MLDPQPGLVILVGVGPDDTEAQALLLADKIAGLRIFADEEGKTNRSLLDIGGGALVVSQFTLFADLRRGRRTLRARFLPRNLTVPPHPLFRPRSPSCCSLARVSPPASGSTPTAPIQC